MRKNNLIALWKNERSCGDGFMVPASLVFEAYKEAHELRHAHESFFPWLENELMENVYCRDHDC